MIFKNLFHKILAILFSASIVLSGFLIFFKTYPDNLISKFSDAVFYGYLKSISKIRGSVYELVGDIKTSREAQSKIDSLKSENNNLRDQLVDYYDMKRENQRLRKLCEIKEQNPDMHLLDASVIGRMVGSSKENIFIDVGKSNGVSVNDAVITENGFIGRVSEVGEYRSSVKTILAPDINIGAIGFDERSMGLISGLSSLANKNLTRMILTEDNNVNVSDILSTSGFSGIYPKKLKIGTVKSIEYDASNSCRYAVVAPFDVIDDVQNVFVITNFANKGILDY